MLPRKHKLTRLDIDSLFNKGGVFNGVDFSLKYRLENPQLDNKFAVIVGKKVATSSVRRHEIKRRIMAFLDKSSYGRGKNGLFCAILIKKDTDLNNNLILLAISDVLARRKR